jgi:hypothetical protein
MGRERGQLMVVAKARRSRASRPGFVLRRDRLQWAGILPGWQSNVRRRPRAMNDGRRTSGCFADKFEMRFERRIVAMLDQQPVGVTLNDGEEVV